MLLINATDETKYFEAQDSRLYIVQEAKDRDTWKPIEYLPNSWCGNSYHQVFLQPGEFWAFAAPIYHGDYKTRLRFKLTLHEEEQVLYSNEFSGSINREQFTVKPDYTPQNLMDPYDE